jgi:hypothetical protein
MVPPADLRAQIRVIRSLTARPFGVNLLLHTDLQPPIGEMFDAMATAYPDREALIVRRTGENTRCEWIRMVGDAES